MSVFQGMNVRPLRDADIGQLEKWRREYTDGTLTLPKGYVNYGVETACADQGGTLIGSLTATSAVIIDPFIHDPSASGVDVFTAVYLMDRTLCYQAQRGGAVAAYTSVPVELTDYHSILRRSGYAEVGQGCKVFRRPLTRDLAG